MQIKRWHLWVRLLALSLVSVMALSLLAGCTDPSENPDDTSSGSESESGSDSNTDTDVPDLPRYTVTVVDSDNAPLSDVKVKIYGAEDDENVLYTGTTNDQGVYGFDAPTATYRVAATSETHETETAFLSFAEGSTELTVAMQLLPDAATAFTVSNVFSNDMVVQRGEHVRVWGWADESQNGKRVSGKFLGTVAHTVIENGEWVLTFDEQWEANTNLGNTMTIYGDGVEYHFTDVLVGDVYMAIGQSNIEYRMEVHLANVTSDKKGTLDEDALIRLHFNSQDQEEGYPARGTTTVCKEIMSDSRWELPTKANYMRFSALGYYFAEKMLAANGNTVPIGIIEVEAAGMHLAGFLNNEIADATGADTYNSKTGIYTSSGANGVAATRYVYNRYIYPFERYAIKGIVWYQGESDLHDANTLAYAERFVPLMEHMRETHNVINKDFPIYMIELARCFNSDWSFGTVRAVQGNIAATQLTNAYLIPTSDLLTSMPRDILHPDNKWEVSDRLVAVAAAVEYGQSTLDATLGPVLVSIELSENGRSAVLTYANVGDGLTTKNGSKTVKGFVSMSEDFSTRTNVRGEITAYNQITITSTKPIVCIGYNTDVTYVYGTNVTLCNSEGIPAAATIAYVPGES